MKKTVITAVVACLLGAATVGAVGSAATKKGGSTTRQSQTAPSTTPSGPPPTMKEMLAKRDAARDAHLKKVADDLNVSLDDLKKAMDEVRDDRLAAAVKDNRLTQAQADAIKACADAPLTCDRSNLPAFGFRGGHRMGGPRVRGDDFFAALAKKLGKSTEEVRKAFETNRPAGGPRGFDRDHDGPHGRGHGGPGMPGGPGMGGPGGPGMGGPGMGGPGGAF